MIVKNSATLSLCDEDFRNLVAESMRYVVNKPLSVRVVVEGVTIDLGRGEFDIDYHFEEEPE